MEKEFFLNPANIIFPKFNFTTGKQRHRSDEHFLSPRESKSLNLNIPTTAKAIFDCKMKFGLPTEMQAKILSGHF
jgi:hypothetical protein